MNVTVLSGVVEKTPQFFFLTNRNLLEICKGILCCQESGKKEYYPFLAVGSLAKELADHIKKGDYVDLSGKFLSFNFSDSNYTRHRSYFLLVHQFNDKEQEGKDFISKCINQCSGKMTEEIDFLVGEDFAPIDYMDYEKLAKL